MLKAPSTTMVKLMLLNKLIKLLYTEVYKLQ